MSGRPDVVWWTDGSEAGALTPLYEPPAGRQPSPRTPTGTEARTAPSTTTLVPEASTALWLEMSADLPLQGLLEVPTSVLLRPAGRAAEMPHAIRGHGNEALRRSLAEAFRAHGFDVLLRTAAIGGPAAPWTLLLDPPHERPTLLGTLVAAGDVRILAHAKGAFHVEARGELEVEEDAAWQGRLSAGGAVRVGERSRVLASVSSPKEVAVGAGAFVAGPVRCGALRLAPDARVAGGVLAGPAGSGSGHPAVLARPRDALPPEARPAQPKAAPRRPHLSDPEIDALRTLEESTTEFLKTAAQRLTSPLTPLRLQLHALQAGSTGQLTPAQTAAVGRLDGSVRQLEDLVHEFLKVASLQAGESPPEKAVEAGAGETPQAPAQSEAAPEADAEYGTEEPTSAPVKS